MTNLQATQCAPGSAEERAACAALQARMPEPFEKVFPDPKLPRAVIVLPSLTVGAAVMAQIAGAPHYEERLLCLLMLLCMPRTQLLYLTTTHPFLMLEFLTDGKYDPATGISRTPQGSPRAYYAIANLVSPAYRGLTPADLVDIAVRNGPHYDATTQEGVMFHLIGALSEFGKLGVVCVAADHRRAFALYRQAVAALDTAGAGRV
jgi:hypothetical protein